MRRSGLAVTLLLSLALAAYGGFVLLDELAREETRTVRTLVLPADGRLAVETGSGDVSAEASDGPPRVELVSQGGLFGAPELRLERGADGRVSVRTTCDAPLGLLGCSGSLRLLVGAESVVAVETGSGEVAVRGLRAGVVAKTGSGSVTLTDVSGPEVAAETGSGDLDGTGVTTRRLVADTGSGDVTLALTSAPDEATVRTGSGDVDLTVPDDVYDVGTDTGSGTSRVTVRTDVTAPRRLRVTTGSGDLRVAPAG